jgi:hypothetical protein
LKISDQKVIGNSLLMVGANRRRTKQEIEEEKKQSLLLQLEIE